MRSLVPLWMLLPFSFCLALPIGNPLAPQGGKFTLGVGAYPQHLLNFVANDEHATAINQLVLETLVELSPVTNDPLPRLASRWEASEDRKSITFWIDPRAKFSDGKPVTSYDVKFTWDRIQKTESGMAAARSLFAAFTTVEALAPLQVRFRTEVPHFQNLPRIAELYILPSHLYEKYPSALPAHELYGSGPYRIKSVVPGQRVELERHRAYWGSTLAQNLGRYNFDQITFKVSSNPDTQFELFQRGEVDFHYFTISRQWATQTSSAPFEKHHIEKLKVENSREFGAMAIAWNLRRPLFQDVRVRKALSHLMPKQRWIRDLFFNQYIPASGIVGTRSIYHSAANPPVDYDPRAATRLLKEAGWSLGPDGKQTKQGKRFAFEILTDTPALEKVLTLYQEELARVGIEMKIRNLEWASAMKLLDAREFDAFPTSRSREVEPGNFASEWGSASAALAGSQNVSGLADAEVDRLAAEIDRTFDRAKRIALVRKLDERIGKLQPMSWCWEPTFFRIGHWNRFGFPGKGYFPYSYWSDVFHYWWWDAEKAAKLPKDSGRLTRL